jgi:cytochrome c-type biogenesis protein CcmH/NrfF
MLVYDPPLSKIGLAITGLALLLIFGVAVWQGRRRRDFRIARTRNGIHACPQDDGGGGPT